MTLPTDDTPVPARRCNVLVLEPYFGGSHRAFVEVLAECSRHRYERLTLPARKWKWRMRGAAIWFAQLLADREAEGIDLILTSDMLSVSDLRALLPPTWRSVPIVCYFHENQLTYPLSRSDRRDYQFGFTNITSCLGADAVWFNSAFQRDAFLEAAERLLAQMPDAVPPGVVGRLRERARVYWPPVRPSPADVIREARPTQRGPLTLLWNHRWEYDKNPEEFFGALFRLCDEGYDFRLVVVGESFRSAPDVFGQAWDRLADRTVHTGFLADRRDYWRQLASADVVVSTAIQENFGISIVEALLAGCWPILPARLSYPEILPAAYHTTCLYQNPQQLHEFLAERMTHGVSPEARANLQAEVARLHDVSLRTGAIDDAIAAVAAGSVA